jgi:hypothetical protein
MELTWEKHLKPYAKQRALQLRAESAPQQEQEPEHEQGGGDGPGIYLNELIEALVAFLTEKLLANNKVTGRRRRSTSRAPPPPPCASRLSLVACRLSFLACRFCAFQHSISTSATSLTQLHSFYSTVLACACA